MGPGFPVEGGGTNARDSYVSKITLGETFFICWIMLHQVKFFRLAIAKKKDMVK